MSAEVERARSAWRRVGIVVAVLVVVLLLATFYPLRQLRATRGQLERARVELGQREKEREELEQRAAQLRDPAEIERAARERFGMARPGEVPFILTP